MAAWAIALWSIGTKLRGLRQVLQRLYPQVHSECPVPAVGHETAHSAALLAQVAGGGDVETVMHGDASRDLAAAALDFRTQARVAFVIEPVAAQINQPWTRPHFWLAADDRLDPFTACAGFGAHFRNFRALAFIGYLVGSIIGFGSIQT